MVLLKTRDVPALGQLDTDVIEHALRLIVLPQPLANASGRDADNGIDAGVVRGVAAEYFQANHRLLQVFCAPVERSFHDETQELPEPRRGCETGAGGDPIQGVADCIRRQETPPFRILNRSPLGFKRKSYRNNTGCYCRCKLLPR